MRKILLIIAAILFSFNSFAQEKSENEVLQNIRTCVSFHVENETILPAKSDKEFKLYKDSSEDSELLGTFPAGTAIKDNKLDSVSKIIDRGEYEIIRHYYKENVTQKVDTLYRAQYNIVDNLGNEVATKYDFINYRENTDGVFKRNLESNSEDPSLYDLNVIRESKFEDWYHIRLKDKKIEGYSKTCPLDNEIKSTDVLISKKRKTKENKLFSFEKSKNLIKDLSDIHLCKIPFEEMCCDGYDENDNECTRYSKPMNKILSNITLYKKPSKSSKVLGNFPEGTELKTIDEKPSLRFKESGKYIALHDIYSRYFGTTGGYLSFYTEKNDISTPLIKKGDIIEKLLIGNSDKGSGVILNNENRIPFFITLNNERAYAPILKYNVNLENFFLPITKTEYETWYFIEIEGTNLKGYIEGCPIARQNESCEMC